MVDEFNPATLLDLFRMMGPENRQAFLNLVAAESSSEAIYLMVDKLETSEMRRFSDLCYKKLVEICGAPLALDQ